jgi:hypothetical protein
MASKQDDRIDVKNDVEHVDDTADEQGLKHVPAKKHEQEHGDLYDEALDRYGEAGELDPAVEKKLLR